MSECEHGLTEDCQDCDNRDAQFFNDMEMTCEHDMNEDDCHICQAEYDRLAEQARERQEWDHYHPAGDD